MVRANPRRKQSVFPWLIISQPSLDSRRRRKCKCHFQRLERRSHRKSQRESEPILEVFRSGNEGAWTDEVLVRDLRLEEKAGSAAEEPVSGQTTDADIEGGGRRVEAGLEVTFALALTAKLVSP